MTATLPELSTRTLRNAPASPVRRQPVTRAVRRAPQGTRQPVPLTSVPPTRTPGPVADRRGPVKGDQRVHVATPRLSS